MFLPVVIYVLIIYYWPMLGVRYAFYDYTLKKLEPVGFKHFEKNNLNCGPQTPGFDFLSFAGSGV